MLLFEPLEAQLHGKIIPGGDHRTLVVSRAQVPGGWLVLVVYVAGAGGSGSICFVPDPQHTWDGSSLPAQGASPTPAARGG